MKMRRCLMSIAATSLIVVACVIAPVIGDGTSAEDFECVLCQNALKRLSNAAMTTAHRGATWNVVHAARAACKEPGLPFDGCEFIVPKFAARYGGKIGHFTLNASNVRDECGSLELCPSHEEWQDVVMPDASTNPDLRVALAYGPKGANFVRITIIDNEPTQHTPEFLSFFSYNAPFKWHWTNKTMHTVVKELDNTSDTTTYVVDANLTLRISVPRPGKPVSVLLVADPCFSREFVGCKHGEEWKIFSRLSSLLNVAMNRSDIHGWVLIGDNFYDPYGILSPKFFGALTPEAKSKPVVSVLGNHDAWQHGRPDAKGHDTLGSGYFQYYVMDTAASYANDHNATLRGVPFDYSIIPDREKQILPDVKNFFSYNLLGNVAFITFSGAHDRAMSDPLFAEACQWVKVVQPAMVFVVGHWSDNSMGAKPLMSTRDVHKHIVTLDGCSQIHTRIKWLEGHVHCNLIVEDKVGFRVAGWGMNGCGNFGVPFIHTTEHEFKIGYFPIIGGNGTVPEDQEAAPSPTSVDFDELLNCLAVGGIEGCLKYSVIWHHKKLDEDDTY